MRPPSIVMFDRLFLGSLAITVVSMVMSYDALIAELDSDPAMAQLGIGSGLVMGLVVGSLLLYLLLWFLISRKASNVAKWILVVFVVFSLISIPTALMGPWDLTLALGLVSYALEIAAVVFLFRDDAKAWLKGEWSGDATTFD